MIYIYNCVKRNSGWRIERRNISVILDEDWDGSGMAILEYHGMLLAKVSQLCYDNLSTNSWNITKLTVGVSRPLNWLIDRSLRRPPKLAD
jgi:hypothetical protein